MEVARRPYATARSATGLAALSALSPVAGLGVEVALAWRFGASATVDAFRIAALLIIFGQQFFVTSILPHVVIPVFAEYRAQGRPNEGWHVALSLGNLLLIPTALISVLVFAWPGPVVDLLGPGLTGEARATAVLFIRWFALTYIPLVWSGVAAGMLYAHGIFWLQTASQFLSSMMLVVVILAFGRGLGLVSLVVGVLLGSAGGGLLYTIRVVRLMRQANIPFSLQIDAKHPGVRKTIRLAQPLLGAVIAAQWSAIVVNRVLSELPMGALATFGYAWKMGQLVSLLPTALATVAFPKLADGWQSLAEGEFRRMSTSTLRMALFIAVPLTCIFFALRIPLMTLLFQRGEFSEGTTETAGRLFGLLVLGAPAAVVYVYLQKIFFATHEMSMPTYIQLFGTLLLTILTPMLAANSGVDGVAFASVVVPYLTVVGLLVVLHRRCEAIDLKGLGTFTAKLLLLAAASAWLADEATTVLAKPIGSSVLPLGVALTAGIALATLAFCSTAFLLGLPEARQGQHYLQWQGAVLLRGLRDAVRR